MHVGERAKEIRRDLYLLSRIDDLEKRFSIGVP